MFALVSLSRRPATFRPFLYSRASTKPKGKVEALKMPPKNEKKLIPLPRHKRVLPKMYKVMIVNPDGSTYHIRHEKPLNFIRLPIDPGTLTAEERAERLKRRQKPKKVEEEDFEDDFDQKAYADLFRTNKN